VWVWVRGLGIQDSGLGCEERVRFDGRVAVEYGTNDDDPNFTPVVLWGLAFRG